jgi:hypothetical protein
VATVNVIYTGRPSAMTPALVPVRTDVIRVPAAHALVVGQSAVTRLAARTGFGIGTPTTVKINNYNGTNLSDPKVSALRDKTAQAIQDEKARGGDARGIPPRGRPV